MIRIYRLSELRARYPTSTWVLEDDAGLRVELKNPLSADWVRRWVLAPEWGRWTRRADWRWRWAGLREGLRLLRVTRGRPQPGLDPGGVHSAWPPTGPE